MAQVKDATAEPIGRATLRQGSTFVRSTTEFAEEALAKAVEYCRNRMASEIDGIALLKHSPAGIHDYFRYGLALQVAEFVGQLDATVRSVYICNLDSTPDEIEADPAEVTSPLSLVFRVTRKTAALELLLSDLDDTLTQGYRELVAPQAEKLVSLLDSHIVDDQDILDRTGYGGLMTSVRERPAKVWERT